MPRSRISWRGICKILLNNRLLHLNKKKLFRHIFYHILESVSHYHIHTYTIRRSYCALVRSVSIFHKFMLEMTKDLHMNWTCSTKRDLRNMRTLFYVTEQNISSDRFDRINLSFDKCGALAALYPFYVFQDISTICLPQARFKWSSVRKFKIETILFLSIIIKKCK